MKKSSMLLIALLFVGILMSACGGEGEEFYINFTANGSSKSYSHGITENEDIPFAFYSAYSDSTSIVAYPVTLSIYDNTVANSMSVAFIGSTLGTKSAEILCYDNNVRYEGVGNVTVTGFESELGAISGTFSGSVTNASDEVINITDGSFSVKRFDM